MQCSCVQISCVDLGDKGSRGRVFWYLSGVMILMEDRRVVIHVKDSYQDTSITREGGASKILGRDCYIEENLCFVVQFLS